MTDRLDQLERLGRLRADGLLSEEEFVREKARILVGASPTAPASSTEAGRPSASTASATGNAPTAVPDDNDLLAPIRPIANDQYAGFLVSKVWTAVAALTFVEAVSVIARFIQLLDGRGWASSVSVPAGLALSAGHFLFAGLILWGLGRWVSRRASRVGAVILIVLAMGALTSAVLRPMADGVWLKVGGIALSAFALWFLMGTARGAFALGGRSAPAEPAQGRPSAREAWSQGRKAAAPIRKIMGWIALGWLGLFLIGGVWIWWSTRDTPTDNAAATYSQNASSVAPTGPSSSPPAGPDQSAELNPADLQLRQSLTGTWVEEGGFCASYMSLRLAVDGQVYGEGLFGTWTASGSRLDIRAQSIDMDDVLGPVEEIGGFVRFTSADEFQLSGPDGMMTRYRRCIGGIEPWRSPQAVTGEFNPTPSG